MKKESESPLKTSAFPAKNAVAILMGAVGLAVFPEATMLVLAGVSVGWAWKHLPDRPLGRVLSKLGE